MIVFYIIILIVTILALPIIDWFFMIPLIITTIFLDIKYNNKKKENENDR